MSIVHLLKIHEFFFNLIQFYARHKLKLLPFLLLCSLLIALIYWSFSINQPLVDRHDFRQAQTAISTYYLGSSLTEILNYETPVLGYPWKVPFEFPLFQWLVKTVWTKSSISLHALGRLTSLIFALLCLLPCAYILRLLSCPRRTFQYFLVLFFSSSIYLYWSRTFMIESAALFLTLLALAYYLFIRFYCLGFDSLRNPRASMFRLRPALIPLFYIPLSALLSLALLVKATTSLNIAIFFVVDQLLLMVFFNRRHSTCTRQSKLLFVSFLSVFILVFLSILTLRVWTHHADSLKLLGHLSSDHTSAKLLLWNYGTIAQRFSTDLWLKTFTILIFTPLGLLAFLLLIRDRTCLFPRFQYRHLTYSYFYSDEYFLLVFALLGITPLLMFSNLHIVHEYYQYANAIYFYLCLAILFAQRWESCAPASLSTAFRLDALLIGIVISNYIVFSAIYYQPSFGPYKDNISKLNASLLISSYTHPDSIVLISGDSWSSSIPYHAFRRSIPLDLLSTLDDQSSKSKLIELLGGRKVSSIVYRDYDKIPKAVFDRCSIMSRHFQGKPFKVLLCN